ncbi:PREDICTED: kinesin-like protein KIN-5B isoform X2 [Nelumbo nucifera]|uniref:Kinesin motor domain-containing protein n=2 Tax=Nelumbo nucifera TaxID=4432 RepID=A0A822Y1R8_NELNU|nr:PREDICTED: kinesin-like protein KIN-5B isoform X2 [Nelumbo nucifera]DAD25923.1 TPA_asm: hypothetical protein HUJ06_027391 [Nelumbo nucifera]
MSFTPDQPRKIGLGITPSPSPFLTPRPERRRIDPRGLECNSSRQDKDREVNVQVILRCRPLIDEELRLNTPKLISCNEQRREVTVLQSIANKQIDRSFAFDKVFGPKAQQRSIYDHAISPIVNEVLEGFNCTIFAYGQTGTGKTYTMEGETKSKGGDLSADAGVIPRAVRQIFDTLEAQKADYSMKVTFLELYNEEITDLLAHEEHNKSVEDKQKKPISLMEDGKGAVFVRGLEEEIVYSASEIYNLLEQGSARRRSADTLLNKHSSRSHSVFSITIHVKEATVGDEELIKCGKLNLVDLAGSENISRSGAREVRAREAGEINKSLLTLGRVINALVEHSAHVPYRDSKLTRLLRDSLGGKTKTCIIATISPSAHCLEETLSTLDYAYRAKSIKNKPEANKKMSKAVLLKDLYLEIERIKQDVRAAREKNGVYIPHERFSQDEANKKAMNEKIEQLEIDLDLKGKEVDTFRELYLSEQEQKLDLESELKECRKDLENNKKALQDLEENHSIAMSILKEKEFIVSSLLQSENSIIEWAKDLRANFQSASEDITALFAKIDQKNRMEKENQELLLTFGACLDQNLKSLHKTVLGSVSQQHQQLRCMEEHISSFIASKCDASKVLESRINKTKDILISGLREMKELVASLQKKASADLEQIKTTISTQAINVENFLVNAVLESEEVICDIQSSLDEQKQLLAFSAKKQEEGLQRSLASTRVISEATIGFFNNFHQHACKLIAVIEACQTERSQQLTSFERIFKEECAREEKLALQNIAVTLANLTAKKTAMVSEALRNMSDTGIEEKKRLHEEIFNMQKFSTDAKKEWNEYVEKVQEHFLEDTFSAAETRARMDHMIQECLKRVGYSRQQWGNAQLSINQLNQISVEEMASIIKEKICGNHTVLEDFISISSSTDVKFNSSACDMLESVNDSLVLDHETKKEMEFISTLCLDQIKSIQINHAESILDIRNQAEKCLRKEYSVDHPSSTPKRRALALPTLASIEELRTPAFQDLIAKMRLMDKSKELSSEGKIQQRHQHSYMDSPNRTPFAAVN